MNITNTMCRLRGLTQEQIDSLVDNMPIDNLTSFNKAEKFIGFNTNSYWGTFCGGFLPKIISYTEMMKLLGKAMEFTKSDLKTGMFVKNRNGDYKIVIGELLSGLEACTTLGAFSDSLINKYSKSYDIVAAYKAKEPCFLSKYLNGDSLNLVWEQTGQTKAQKEMEELQAQITKLQEQAKVLQSKL